MEADGSSQAEVALAAAIAAAEPRGLAVQEDGVLVGRKILGYQFDPLALTDSVPMALSTAELPVEFRLEGPQ